LSDSPSTVHNPQPVIALDTLTDLCTPWCVHVIVTLGVPDRLVNGPASIEDLAGIAGADPDALSRVLRHLISKGVFESPAPGVFALNDAARQLTGPSVRVGLGLDGIGGRMAHSWSTLLAAVRTGRPAYHEVFGRAFWDDLAAHPEVAASFDALMGPAGHATPDPEVLLTGDWAGIRTVVDIGGGTGSLLAEILAKHPAVCGVLVDRPATVARAADILEPAGVADRVSLVGQSFFDPLPAGAELYLLKSILFDWPDSEATAILRRAAEAARPGGRVVVIGGVTPDESGEPAPEVLMLVLVGGKGRTLSAFRTLADEAGLRVVSSGRQPSGKYIVECVPKPDDASR
jgi:2,7-dihydroxy-5-methyl-1-naphthoate 7-O-methyltransferase